MENEKDVQRYCSAHVVAHIRKLLGPGMTTRSGVIDHPHHLMTYVKDNFDIANDLLLRYGKPTDQTENRLELRFDGTHGGERFRVILGVRHRAAMLFFLGPERYARHETWAKLYDARECAKEAAQKLYRAEVGLQMVALLARGLPDRPNPARLDEATRLAQRLEYDLDELQYMLGGLTDTQQEVLAGRAKDEK